MFTTIVFYIVHDNVTCFICFPPDSASHTAVGTYHGLPTVLGAHTLLAALAKNPAVQRDTILAGNDGKLPPYLVFIIIR